MKRHDVTERPILFNGQMVPPVLADIKTQTRRALRGFCPPSRPEFDAETGRLEWFNGDEVVCGIRCPYGKPRDRLWVRETWAQPEKRADNLPAWVYAADWPASVRPDHRWRPSIHMPRAASRITLEITDVRVERLQDISEADAKAEGVTYGSTCDEEGYSGGYHWNRTQEDEYVFSTATAAYRALWESINGPGSWDLNPFVWCVTFKRIKP